MTDMTSDPSAAAPPPCEHDDMRKPFAEFAGENGDYFADTFLSIVKAQLPFTQVN